MASSSAPIVVKKTKGKQKIEMKMTEKASDKRIRFSKRKAGIYKQASELVTLTGCHLAILLYSPSGKPYSFANPSFDEVANRFLNGSPPIPDDHDSAAQVKIEELSQKHNEALKQLEVTKEKQKALKPKLKEIPKNRRWIDRVEEATLEELMETEATLTRNLAKLQIRIRKNENDDPMETTPK